MNPDFNRLLLETLSPITLISSVGLLMLCMTARYNHATNRIRQLMAKRRSTGTTLEPMIDQEIAIIYRRCSLLRHGTILLALSTVSSSLLIGISVLNRFWGYDYYGLDALFLMLTVVLLIAASCYFSFEIWMSLHALDLVINRLPKIKIGFLLNKEL